MPRVVITGVGTGVGKTHVACALARALAPHGRTVALKPIETGYTKHEGSDADALERAALHAKHPHPAVTAAAPTSLAAAAGAPSAPLELSAIAAWVDEQEHYTTSHYTIIETPGGLLSPLDARTTNLELAAHLRPAVTLLIAPNRLGCLHAVAAALAAFRDAGATTPWIVLTSPGAPDASTVTNPDLLRARHPLTPVYVLGPRDAGPDAAADLAAALRSRLDGARAGASPPPPPARY
ncbi:MAG: dethiobiotin synthase [Polyangiaceae bacterium]|nr:dethiobiotin synthase [Polyangiaceae bacterium]